MKNVRTRRTLAEFVFHTGYPAVVRRTASAMADIALAVCIGIALGAVIFYNL